MSLAEELSLDVPFSDLKHETLLNLVHTANQVLLVADALFRRFDLTQAQFNVLFALKYAAGNMTQSELGKRLVVTRATITAVLDKLEEKSLVARKGVPGNRRIYHVSLTGRGRKLVEAAEPSYREGIHAVLEGLSDRECRSLIGYLERVRLKAVALRK